MAGEDVADTDVLRQVVVAIQAGDLERAEVGARQVLHMDPECANALHLLGLIARRKGGVSESIDWYQRALAVVPAGMNPAPILSNLGNALLAESRDREAETSFQRALALAPDLVAAAVGRGDALRRLGRFDEAEAVLRSACDREPGNADAWNNWGTVKQVQGDVNAAADGFRRAISVQPAHTRAHYNLGCLLTDCNRLSDARGHLERALELDPAYDDAAAALLRLTQSACWWEEAERLEAHARASVEAGGSVTPLAFVTQPSSAAQQQRCAQLWAQRRFGHVGPLFTHGVRKPGRIRLGYLSSDFHDHATAYLMAGVFEAHDRERFEVFAYSSGADDGGAMRPRLRKAFDRFVDIRSLDDDSAAKAIHEDGIDVLIDLKGYTKDSRTGVLARRPAPVQAQYLGFPGTLGASFIDYAVVDGTVVPDSIQHSFTEKLAYLPDSYQCNDRRREVGPSPSRASCGLPKHGFVFCCFNYPYKIRRPVFASWCRLLNRVPGSVLWLLRSNGEAERSLQSSARALGIDPARLIFADVLPLSEHLGRLQNADLFLDTFPTNAHTTASDALWAGVPVVTIAGETFVSRVAASLLKAADLGELITETPEAYEALAMALATDAARLNSIRARVHDAKLSSALFDTDRFTRALEEAYWVMHERHCAGKHPESFRCVGPVPQPSSVPAPPEERLSQALAAFQAGRHLEAGRLLDQIIRSAPNRPDAWTLLAGVRRALGDVLGARQACERALTCDPGYGDAHNSLGNLDRDAGQIAKALKHYAEALRLRPDVPQIIGNTAGALADAGRHTEALVLFDRALTLDPDNADTHWNRALSRLATGDLRGGFEDYEWRFSRAQPAPREFLQPLWAGEPIDGKTLLVHAEQGLGDALQFARFLPALAARGARMFLEVQAPLARLVRSIPGVSGVVVAGSPLPDFDLHVPLLSLPRVLGTGPEDLDSGVPYLPAIADGGWRSRIGKAAGLKVGLVWAGNPNVKNDARRSPRLEPLLPLLEVPGVTFFALQKGDGLRDLDEVAGPKPVVLDGELGDLADTAAAMASMDLVITSDTSVAHLSGALGVRAWVMLATVADWRWIGSEHASRWYPTLRLFRQEAPGDWAGVVCRLASELEQLGLNRANPDALLHRALPLLGRGELALAELECDRALDADPTRADTWTLAGVIARRRGLNWRAVAAYVRAQKLAPGYTDAHQNLGNLHKSEGRYGEAVSCYHRALDCNPASSAAWNELSDALRLNGDPEGAVQAAERALELVPNDRSVFNNLGAALSASKRKEEAEVFFRRALAQHPDMLESRYNLGVILHGKGEHIEAEALFRGVLETDPKHVGALYNLGVVLQGRSQILAAEATYRNVLEQSPEHCGALANLSVVCHLRRKYAEALALQRRLLAITPDNLMVQVATAHMALKCSEWGPLEGIRRLIDRAVAEAETGEAQVTFPFLSFPGGMTEGEQLVLARAYAKDVAAKATPFEPLAPLRKSRIRLGYASSDFHNHATMHLMRGLFRRHDRSRFEVFAYSWGPDDKSSYRREVEADVDVFRNVADQRSQAIAEQIRADGIDILVDLKGYTQDCRPEIFAYRPAPVQVQYLGYPGTMGADFIDYVITDRIVTPPSQQVHYTERFAYLPNCYQVNDNEQRIAPIQPTRAECGLPDKAVVFACFCTHYKIEPDAFACWMEILKAVSDSVLWMIETSNEAMERLRTAAAAAGVKPERLVFGRGLNKDEHLARLRNADLFLDTFYYNAHTTASDALWAGVPVLTLPGKTFASRVGASLVMAAGLPELIAEDRQSYIRGAIELGTNPMQLQEIRRRLMGQRLTCALFDTDRFARDMDGLLERIAATAFGREQRPSAAGPNFILERGGAQDGVWMESHQTDCHSEQLAPTH